MVFFFFFIFRKSEKRLKHVENTTLQQSHLTHISIIIFIYPITQVITATLVHLTARYLTVKKKKKKKLNSSAFDVFCGGRAVYFAHILYNNT